MNRRVKGELLRTEDGSMTLRHEVLGELYHSDRGAAGESEHIYIREGLGYFRSLNPAVETIAVFEVGFGTGLNAWLTWEYGREKNLKIDYYTVELYPLDIEFVETLEYTKKTEFNRMHTTRWNARAVLDDHFTITKYLQDLLGFDPGDLDGCIDVVYFDAFSPEVQPDLWTEMVFGRMYALLKPGGILVTYSAKGIVKEALRAVGFEVHRCPGALGKRHMVRAVKA